jgi:hypothetical protein
MTIKPIMKAIIKFGKKHSTKLLAGGAIGAELLGFWFMHKEAPVVRKKLDELPKGSGIMAKIKVAGPIYWPAFLMLGVSSGCIVGGCVLGEAKLAEMTSLAMASEAALTRYEKKVIDELGPEKANEIQQGIAKDLMNERPNGDGPVDVIATANGADIFYDTLSGRYFTSCAKAIYEAKDKVNSEIQGGIGMWVTVNEWYSELGIDPIPLGKGKAWNIDHLLNVKIGDFEETPDGRPCKPILYFSSPVIYNGKAID